MTETAPRTEMGTPPRRSFPIRGLLFLGLAVVVVIVDQVTKRLAEDQLERSGVHSVPVVDDVLRFTYVENRGAAFGLLQQQTAFFIVVGLIVIGVIAASYRYLPRSGLRLHLALGLQLGGAVGNLIDRVRQGYVVDFVDFGYHANWWPVFNVADSAIVIGVALLALNALGPTRRTTPRRSMPPAEGLDGSARRPLRAVSHQGPNGRIVVVPPFAAGDRLDGFLMRHGGEPDRSRSEWQRLIGEQAVRLNGAPSKPSQRVATGDRVLIVPVRRQLDLPAEAEVPFEVVYVDPAMIVIDKPAGVVVHPAPGNETGTLVNGLLARFPELRGGPEELRPGIVHRLDKDTSGLLVVARTLEATAELQRQMQARSTEKRYLLLVRGTIGEDEGLIDAPIARDLRNRQRMAVRAGGRLSQTRFFVRERFGAFCLVEALLLTGRTHQLRVHFASIGHPVAGDTTYGRGAAPAGLSRQFVHAAFLRLRSPADGQEHSFRSPLPPDLAEPLARLRRQKSPRGA